MTWESFPNSLIERLAFGTVDEALENQRMVLDASESDRRK
jgi:hypothetical protein